MSQRSHVLTVMMVPGHIWDLKKKTQRRQHTAAVTWVLHTGHSSCLVPTGHFTGFVTNWEAVCENSGAFSIHLPLTHLVTCSSGGEKKPSGERWDSKAGKAEITTPSLKHWCRINKHSQLQWEYSGENGKWDMSDTALSYTAGFLREASNCLWAKL